LRKACGCAVVAPDRDRSRAKPGEDEADGWERRSYDCWEHHSQEAISLSSEACALDAKYEPNYTCTGELACGCRARGTDAMPTIVPVCEDPRFKATIVPWICAVHRDTQLVSTTAVS